MRRRTALGWLAATLGTSGCLRLESEDAGTASTTAETSVRTQTATETEPPTTAEPTTEPRTTDAETTEEETTQEDADLPPATGSWQGFANGPRNLGQSDGSGFDSVSVAWTHDFQREGAQASPTVADGTVYVPVDGLHAFDAETGDRRWSADVGGASIGYASHVDGTVVAGVSDRLLAVDPADGTVRWRQTLRMPVHGLTVGDGTAYANYNVGMAAVDLSDGSTQWDVTFEANTQTSPALTGDLALMGFNDGSFAAFSRADGSRVWRNPVASGYDHPDVRTSVTVGDGLAYTGSWNRFVYAFDPATGEVAWETRLNGGVSASPALRDGVLYVGHDGEDVNGLDAQTGEPRYESTDRSGSNSALVVATADDLLVLDEEGVMVGFGRDSGAMNWTVPMSRDYANGGFAVTDTHCYVVDGRGVLHAIAATG